MHAMDEGVRSSKGLIKKMNSSGCLIIKKKVDGSRKVFESNKERKRSRLVLSESGSSDDEPEPSKKKAISKTESFHNSSVGQNGKIESETKSRLDAFEFDKNNAIDGKRSRNDYGHHRFKHTIRRWNESEFETGSSRLIMIEKRKKSYFDSGRNSSRKKVPDYTFMNRLETVDNKTHSSISSFRQKVRVPSDEPIRLQGKNGVLKVMVNKKTKMDVPSKFRDRQLVAGDRKGSTSEIAIKKDKSIGPSFYSDSKGPEKVIPIIRAEKSENKGRKLVSKGGDSETEHHFRPGSPSGQASKGVRKTDGIAPSAEKLKRVKEQEVKNKHGSGTEKQLLREKIRHMLISAGWTIDYRPRRNRDYLDSVYINPSGTAYWSIVKAYDAFRKQQDKEDADVKPSEDSSQFMPLPDELLSKLTRQTQKKIQRELKMKRKHQAMDKRGKEKKEESAEDTDNNNEEKQSFHKKHNGKSPKRRSDGPSSASVDDSSSNLSPKPERSGKLSTVSSSHIIQGRKTKKIGRCTLLIRSSDKKVNSESDGYVPYTGKRTVISWLIDSGVVHVSERVQYMNRKRSRTMLEGWATRDGIHCGCCSKILSVSKFEIHAGSKLRQPFQNIYLESGISLSQCQIEAWNRQEESSRSGFHTAGTDGDDPDDDTCGLCGDGGDLICCDGCPSTFHQSCLDIQMLPPGDWHCPNCICKFCGIAGEVSAVGDSTVVRVLLTCSLCEKKYHESCSQEMEPADVNASTSFCGKKCQELFDSLQKLIGIKHELQGGFSWSLIHRTEIGTDVSHRGFPHRVECNSKLAVALFVMNECFLPIVDRRSGINLIHNVLYNCGSNFSRLNYSSFYTAILEKGDEIVAAASIRIRGTQLAEMPFIGTRHLYRRQGICRRLLSAIELALCSLKVEKLFIPAIAEHMNTWTVVFGFKPLEESHKLELRSLNMLVFPDTDMLQKPLVAQKNTGENITADSDTKSILIKEDLRHAPDFTKKSDADSSSGHDLISCDDVIMQNADEIDDKSAVVDSGMEVLAVPFDGNALLHSSGMSCEPKVEVLNDEMVALQSHSKEKSAKASLSSELHNDLLKMEKPVLDPSVGGNSSEEIVGDVVESNVKASVVERVLDSLEETSAIDTAEEIKGDKKPLSVSSVELTDETTKESNSDLSPRISDRMEYKLHVASESEAKVDDEPVEGNIQCFNHDAEVKLLDSLGEISAMKGKIKENPDSVFVSPSNGNDERTSHLNQPDAVDLQSKLNAASLVNAEVAFDARVAPVEGNVQSYAVSGSGDAPVLDFLHEFCTHNTAEDVKDNLTRVPFSNLCEKDENITQFNPDLDHQSKIELVPCEAAAAPVKIDIRFPVVGDIDDEGNDGKVVCVEADLDSFGEISAQEKEINKCVDPAESTIQLNSDLNKQNENAFEVESNLHAASEVGLGGSNILSSAEDDGGKEAREVNVINTPAEISVENGTEEIKASVAVPTEFHESDDSSVQFESDRNNRSANAMETA